jgi:hypothetical protein|tara:strand:+ start:203 stop:496 length:294 start_codon:yes stop_codon:yes gene_type:complete
MTTSIGTKNERMRYRERSKYYTNKAVRKKIDKILELNATYCANLGTGTPLDLGSKEAVEKKWVEMAQGIFDLDPEYYVTVMKNTDGNILKHVALREA